MEKVKLKRLTERGMVSGDGVAKDTGDGEGVCTELSVLEGERGLLSNYCIEPSCSVGTLFQATDPYGPTDPPSVEIILPGYMAALLGRRRAKNPENCRCCHCTGLFDCHWISHPTDLQGELPLMENVFSWKEGRGLSAMKHHSDAKRKGLLQCNHTSSHGRSLQIENQTEAGAPKTGFQKYVLQHCSALQLERDSSRLKMGGTLQADGYQLKHPYLSFVNHTGGDTGVLTDDEFSLHHWLDPGHVQQDVNISTLQGQKKTTDTTKSESSKSITARRHQSLSSHIYELSDRQCMKKRKLSTSKGNAQLLPYNVEDCCRLISNPHLKHFQNCSGIFKVKQPIFVQKDHACRSNRTEAYLDYCIVCQSPCATGHTAMSESQKALDRCPRARLFTLEDEKPPYCDGELYALQQSKGKKSKSWRRFSGNSGRKILPNCSRACHFSDMPTRRWVRPIRVVNVKAKSKSEHKPRLEMKDKKETQAMFIPRESLACSCNNHTLDAGVNGKDVDGSCGTLAANRQALRKGDSGSSNVDMQDDHKKPISSSLKKARTLSQTYRPAMLQDLIGQTLVARALSNAILKDKVAPVYLFQGSHGTGKTSAARIFAMALNCTTTEESKPCGLCRECSALISGNASYLWDVDAASHNGRGLVHELVKSIEFATPNPKYKVVIIDECHMFSFETWSTLVKIFEEPVSNAVFILITSEPDKLPCRVTSRCQTFHFLRIKRSDIVNRLDHIAKLENIYTEPGALSLIASKSDGCLRSAETILDQVSLLEQRITSATIHKLVGSVSDEELKRLLDLALCSDMVGTVQKTREIVDFGVEPLELLSQLATLITDILAGSYVPTETSKKEGCSLHALSGSEMERLQAALRILSEAERQLREVSLCRTTWLIAALLQLGPKSQHKSQAKIMNKSLAKASPATSKRARGFKLKVCNKGREATKTSRSAEMVLNGISCIFEALDPDKVYKSELEPPVDCADRLDPLRKYLSSPVEGSSLVANEEIHIHLWSPSNVGSLWLSVLNFCEPISVRQLLQSHGKLQALTFSAVNIVASVVFEKPAQKTTAEMYRVCIANSFKKLLGPSVEVQFSLASDLEGGGCASCPAAIDDALCTQSTFKHCSDCKSYTHQIKKETFDVEPARTPSCHAGVVPPLATWSSSPPLMKDSSLTISGAETTMPKQQSSKTSISYPNGHFPMHTQDAYYKKHPRRHCWRHSVGLHAKMLLCDCVLACLINHNSSDSYSDVQNS
ncbi:hypothetical protein L7F22_041245 [Adiantum nelumboides]|nr:hypothetical protein [Adiantum nelumboides]